MQKDLNISDFFPNQKKNVFEPCKAIRRLLYKLKAVRLVVGDQMELMVDLHTRFSPDEAIWFCREAEDLDLFLVEDPIRSENVTSYRNLRKSVRVPLAAGEQWASKWEFRQAIEEELIDYARIDLCVAGSLTEARKIAGWCETHYIKILPHNPLGPVCTAASLHLNIATNNSGPQELVPPLISCYPMCSNVHLNSKVTKLHYQMSLAWALNLIKKRQRIILEK